jgi:tetratricopeptide (TPR) repeat protein
MKYFPVLTAVGIALMLGVSAPALSQPEQPSEGQQPATTSAPSEALTPEKRPAETPPGETPKKQKRTFTLNADAEALKLTDDIKVAKAQLKKHPDDPEAHFLMAAAYSRSPYLEKAFSHITKVKRMLKEKKDFEFIDRTIVGYETLAETNPNDPVILYRLAMGYYFKGYSLERYPQYYASTPVGDRLDYYQKAKDTMLRVIDLNPKDTWARNYLGYLVSENGKDLSKAIGIWEESLAVDSERNPGAYLLLSQAYLQQGNLKQALFYGAKGMEIKQAMGMTLP